MYTVPGVGWLGLGQGFFAVDQNAPQELSLIVHRNKGTPFIAYRDEGQDGKLRQA
jgi:hypothetical protein